MAEAHLKTVQNTINDLEQQSLNLQEELKRLKEYLSQGIETLTKESSN
tara:strand:- start:627 stop:770 length:144 start_codon:yes stop_codon:yes gene_type:complete